jgi:tRNA(Ile)-lysidine synthase
MIQIQGTIDRHAYVACSGGVDSMAVVDFLRRSHDVTLLFFDHKTEDSADARQFVADYVDSCNRQFTDRPNATAIDMIVGELNAEKRSDQSLEEFWREQRYGWLRQFNAPVITCHHLDDCVETWVWSSMHGEGKIIPYTTRNIVRPFRLNRKSEFINWCRRRGVQWFEEASNADVKHVRNYIRHELIHKLLVVNPGLHKVIRKKVKADVPAEVSDAMFVAAQ